MGSSVPLISSGRAFAVRTACTFSGVPEREDMMREEGGWWGREGGQGNGRETEKGGGGREGGQRQVITGQCTNTLFCFFSHFLLLFVRSVYCKTCRAATVDKTLKLYLCYSTIKFRHMSSLGLTSTQHLSCLPLSTKIASRQTRSVSWFWIQNQCKHTALDTNVSPT